MAQCALSAMQQLRGCIRTRNLNHAMDRTYHGFCAWCTEWQILCSRISVVEGPDGRAHRPWALHAVEATGVRVCVHASVDHRKLANDSELSIISHVSGEALTRVCGAVLDSYTSVSMAETR